MAKQASIILLLCLIGAYATKNNQRIVGGLVAETAQFPYQASLRYNPFDHICGGSIISEKVILTAATCINLLSTISDLTVVVGTNELNYGGVEHAVDYWVLHPEFQPLTTLNDVAILILLDAIEYNDFVQPISLSVDEVNNGEELLMSGWGRTSYPESPMSNLLRYFYVNNVEIGVCKDAFEELYPNINFGIGHLCAKASDDKMSCHGDEGGPVVNAAGEQVAIFSWTKLCDVNYPEVYTSVAYFRDWILSFSS